MKTTAWSHLPNAAHIDRILASVNAHPKEWTTIVAGPASTVAKAVAKEAAQDAAREAAWLAAWDASRTTEWEMAWEAAWMKVSRAGPAWGAIAALIAWDDSAQYLAMTADELRVFYALSERPECLLLLPAVVAFEKIKELVVS